MGAVTKLADGQLCPNPNCGQNNPRSNTVCQKCGTEQRQLLGKETVLKGRFQIDAVLGYGGFGAVYKAIDLLTGQFVSVKENRQHRTFNCFMQEANLLMTLNHPHLPRVHETFLDEVTIRAYLVMDYASGENLESLIRKRGKMSFEEAKSIFAPLVDAIGYLHENGVVHRDIKPANIIVITSANNQPSPPNFDSLRQYMHGADFRQARKLLRQLVNDTSLSNRFATLQIGPGRLMGIWHEGTSGQRWHLWIRFNRSKIQGWRCECPDWQEKKHCAHLLALLALYRENPSAFVPCVDSPLPPVALVDFGVAKVMEPVDPHRPHSSSFIAWTDGFSPPEQYRSDVEADPKVDQYSLAATLLFALTGETPPDAITRLERARKGERTLEPRRAEIPGTVLGAIERALSLDPKNRFPTVRDFWEAACKPEPKGALGPQIPVKVRLKSLVSEFRHRIPFLTPARSLVGHTDSISALAFSPHHHLLASGSFDRTVRLWELRGMRLTKVLKGHEDSVIAVTFSDDGRRLCSASIDKTVRLWLWEEGHAVIVLHCHAEAVLTMANSLDGKFFATGSADGVVRLFQWQNSQLVWRSEPLGAFVNALAFSPDGRFLVFGCADGVVGFLSTRNGRLLGRLCETGWSITDLAFSPDGVYLAVAGEGFNVQIWKLPEGKIVRTLKMPPTSARNWVNAFSFSPDGQILATASMDEVVRLWRVSDGKLYRTLKGHKGWVTSVAFSPDGKWLASGSSDKTILIWKLH